MRWDEMRSEDLHFDEMRWDESTWVPPNDPCFGPSTLEGCFTPPPQDVKQQAEAALAMGMDRHGLKKALGGGEGRIFQVRSVNTSSG